MMKKKQPYPDFKPGLCIGKQLDSVNESTSVLNSVQAPQSYSEGPPNKLIAMAFPLLYLLLFPQCLSQHLLS